MATSIEIETRRIGDSPVVAPRVMLGCGNFGGVGSAPAFFGKGMSDDEAFAVMDAGWEMGLTHFDTADAYGGGHSETTIGRWCRSRGVRPQITTKTYNPMDEGRDHGLSRARIERQIESSLERLGVDQVDLYLAHEFDPEVPIEETFGAFRELVGDGMIRAYGVSNWDAAQLQRAIDAGAPACVQNAYSLLERADEPDLLPLCESSGVSYAAFGPLAGGWLAGRYRRGQPFPEGSRMTQRPEPYEKFMTDGVFDALEEMERMAAERDVSMGGLALAWLLSEPRVSFVVVGPTRPEHLEPVREALAVQLGEDERRTIGSLFS